MSHFNFERLLPIFFPADCQNCRENLPAGEKILCSICINQLTEHRIPFQQSWVEPSIPSIRNAWTAFQYQEIIRDLLQRVKFKHEFYLLQPLSKMAASLFQAIVSDLYYDGLIPMPVHFFRRWNRRFNQSEILAQNLAVWCQTPILPNLLYKKVDTHAQSEMNKEARRWNVFGAFGVRHPEAVQGKSFLLIDDIVTTGSTASEAAQTLLKHGAKRVDLFALAHASVRSQKNSLASCRSQGVLV